MFAVCLDIGGLYAGAMVGAMNMASQLGGFLGSVVFGYLVARTGSYNVGFVPMAALLLLGIWLWFRIDPTVPLSPVTEPLGLAVLLTAQGE
jgi:predicted MFS family arabinose efflux permease